MAALATAALLAALLLIPVVGRADDRVPGSGERFTLLEHVQVVGSCFEDHVGESASYAGFIDKWRDGKKNQDLLHGSVANFDRPDAAAKYHPPAAIQFGEVGADRLGGTRLVLKGLTNGDRLPLVESLRPAVRSPVHTRPSPGSQDGSRAWAEPLQTRETVIELRRF